MSIITQKTSNSEKISTSVSDFFHRFHVASALKKSNAVHKRGFRFLLFFLFYWPRSLPTVLPIGFTKSRRNNCLFRIRPFAMS